VIDDPPEPPEPIDPAAADPAVPGSRDMPGSSLAAHPALVIRKNSPAAADRLGEAWRMSYQFPQSLIVRRLRRPSPSENLLFEQILTFCRGRSASIDSDDM